MLGFFGFVGNRDQEPIHPHAQEVLAGQDFIFEVVVGLGKQDAVASFFGGLQGSADGGGEKVMDDLRYNHPQDGSPIFSEIDRHRIGYILVLGRIFFDELNRFLR